MSNRILCLRNSTSWSNLVLKLFPGLPAQGFCRYLIAVPAKFPGWIHLPLRKCICLCSLHSACLPSHVLFCHYQLIRGFFPAQGTLAVQFRFRGLHHCFSCVLKLPNFCCFMLNINKLGALFSSFFFKQNIFLSSYFRDYYVLQAVLMLVWVGELCGCCSDGGTFLNSFFSCSSSAFPQVWKWPQFCCSGLCSELWNQHFLGMVCSLELSN